MRKYYQERFDIVSRNTGVKICEAGCEEDALMMVAFDPENRVYNRHQFLMGEVVDVVVPKALPTNEVVRSPVQPEPLRLSEDQREPVRVS